MSLNSLNTVFPYQQAPFFRLLLPFIAGTLLQIYFPIFDTYLLYVLVVLLIVYIALHLRKKPQPNYSTRWLFGVYIYLLLILIGITNTYIHQTKYTKIPEEIGYTSAFLTLQNLPTPTSKTIKTTAIATAYKKNKTWHKCYDKIQIYIAKDSLSQQLNENDQIIANIKLTPIKNYGNPPTFDYVSYMKRQGITHQAYIRANRWKLRTKTFNIRKYFLNTLQKYGIHNEQYAVLSALTLGAKQYLNKDIKQNFSRSGAMHILAVSGLHVGIIYLIISQILNRSYIHLVRYGRFFKIIILLFSIWSFAYLTAFSPSVQRASIMFSFIIIGKNLRRSTNIYNTLSAAAFLQIFITPHSITQLSFQLSYLAILSIVYFYPKLSNLYQPKNFLLRKIWQLTAITTTAQIGTAPLIIHHFQEFPSYSLFANFIIIPLAFALLTTTLALFAFSNLPTIASFIAILLNHATQFLNYTTHKISTLPFSILNFSLNQWSVWAIYLSIFLVSILFIQRKESDF